LDVERPRESDEASAEYSDRARGERADRLSS